MGLRSALLFELSRRLLSPPAERTADQQAYQDWRSNWLAASWSAFSDSDVRGKDVLDFGCGDGGLSLYLATTKAPRQVIGVDLNPAAIARADAALAATRVPDGIGVSFCVGSESGIPRFAESIDTVVAFDCLEHIMEPLEIFREWHRVLRPGGKCLAEWFPYKGPWGPHMESLIPVPWAHVVFGQKAMFRAAERIYDLPAFVPRHWDRDGAGRKKPNKWRAWSSFKEQRYINELDLRTFQDLVAQAGLRIGRLEKHSFSGSKLRQSVGKALMDTPVIGEYFVSYTVIELYRPL